MTFLEYMMENILEIFMSHENINILYSVFLDTYKKLHEVIIFHVFSSTGKNKKRRLENRETHKSYRNSEFKIR